jgi:RND family efflux transporter MFP subunit
MIFQCLNLAQLGLLSNICSYCLCHFWILSIRLLNKYACVALLLASVFLYSKSFAAGFTCLIEPSQTVELGNPVTGRLDHVYVKRGDLVEKNQTLAKIESKAEYAASELAKFMSQQVGPSKVAESRMAFSKKKLNRRQELASQKLMPMKDSEDTESELRVAEAEFQIAKENRQIARLALQQQNSLLDLRTIRSPVDGVVVDQGAFQGEVFEPGSSKKYILKVAEMNPLKVHVILPKILFGQLKKEMVANISPEIPQGRNYSGKVNMIDR